MKYCRQCKLMAKANAETCSRCGETVGGFGGVKNGTDSGSTDGPALGLQGQMAELEAVAKRNLRFSRLLLGICGAIVLALLLTGWQVYSSQVLSYAVLENVTIEQDDLAMNRVNVAFNVVTPGRVAFDRRSDGSRTEKLDEFATPGPVKLSWTWPSKDSIDFRVVFRGGMMRAAEQKMMAVGDVSNAIDIVFIMDSTRSMTPFIDGLKQNCIEFAETVNREGHDCRLGLVGFGDVDLNEPIEVFPPTADLQLFRDRIGNLEVTGGGDNPESSVEALQRALTIPYRENARVCMVHITDAGCHNAGTLPRIASQLKDRSITTYVVSSDEYANLYMRLCNNGGEFFSIEDAGFEDILDNVARSIVNEIRYQQG
jgi:Mg-chelatase subunit ChlD